ncbi:MAG: AAA family ATPase [Thermodesulfobacteriota bacterium]|nr:AAA family ATPase [Thermodesulfobacteriota bacterium]
MKISICGKGGSGKSTLVALLAVALKEKKYRVLVVDSDESNSGLFRMLGFDSPPVPLMDLMGGKKGVKQKMAVRFSSGEPEHKMDVMTQDTIRLKEISSPYMQEKDGIRLVAVGKILQSLEGCACPMGVLSREFLKKLCLEPDEVVLVDMEAGIEHFGRGVETSVDTVLIVVEPSFESLSLAKKVHVLASEIGLCNVWAVLNKISSEELALKLKCELVNDSVTVIGSVCYDPTIFEACLEGNPFYMHSEAMKDSQKILDKLL